MLRAPYVRLALALLSGLPASPQPAAPAGREKLTYEIEWRFITAGRATLDREWADAEEASGWRIHMRLESSGMVSKLYKVDDTYESQLTSELCAERTHLIAHEGRRHRETTVTFDGEARQARYLETDLATKTLLDDKRIDIPPCVLDVLGGLYKLRTLRIEPGQSVNLPLSDGKKSVLAKVEAQEREAVQTPAGAFKTIRYQAYLFDNVLYRRSARLYVWLTDDARRLPVQIKVRMQFTIGTITLQLEKEEHS